MRACRVIVFAKAPLPGYAKTRLIPALGADGAARLAARMLDATVAHAVAADIGAVELCCAPDATHTAFGDLAARYGVRLHEQGDGDLGARMLRAFERVLGTNEGAPRAEDSAPRAHDRPPRAHDSALLIGTDAPGLDAAYLRAARDALRTHDAVCGPTADGGYALIGLKRPLAALFEGMPWSTSAVMALTRERLRAAGLAYAELPLLHDIDEPADLAVFEAGRLAAVS